MQEKIQLNPGDTLKQISHSSKGTMAETDIWNYEILNADGEKTGSITHTDHTSIKGFHRTQSIVQRDLNGKIVVDVSW